MHNEDLSKYALFSLYEAPSCSEPHLSHKVTFGLIWPVVVAYKGVGSPDEHIITISVHTVRLTHTMTTPTYHYCASCNTQILADQYIAHKSKCVIEEYRREKAKRLQNGGVKPVK